MPGSNARANPFYSPQGATSKTELYSRITLLEEENDTYRDLLLQWKNWYKSGYKPQITWLNEKVNLLLDPRNLAQMGQTGDNNIDSQTEGQGSSFNLSKSSSAPYLMPKQPLGLPVPPPLPNIKNSDPHKIQSMEKFYQDQIYNNGFNRGAYMDKETLSYHKAKILQDFYERQTTSSYSLARAMSLANRAEVDKLTTSMTAFNPVTAAKEFRASLRKRYRSLRRGWHQALDPLNMKRLGFFEFCTSVRAMGYTGNLKSVWNELAQNGSISYEELDPKGFEMTKDFKIYCIDAYGSILRAWNEKLDPDDTNRVKQHQFIQRVIEMGWGGDGKRVFEYLNSNGVEVIGPTSGFLTLKDVCEDSWEAKKRGLKDCYSDLRSPIKTGSRARHDQDNYMNRTIDSLVAAGVKSPQGQAGMSNGFTTGSGFSPNTTHRTQSPGGPGFGNFSGGSPNTTKTSGFGLAPNSMNSTGGFTSLNKDPLNQLKSPRLNDRSDTDYAYLPEPHLSNSTCMVTKAFLDMLCRKYKSLRHAWYAGLDPHHKGLLTLEEFVEGCTKRLHFKGNCAKVFSTLDYQRSGTVSMADLNPRANEALKDVTFQLNNRFGTIVDAFHPYHLGTSSDIDMESFYKLCEPFQFKVSDIRRVFEWLDVYATGLIRGDSVDLAGRIPPKDLTNANHVSDPTNRSDHSRQRREDEIHMRWEHQIDRSNGNDVNDPGEVKRSESSVKKKQQKMSANEALAMHDHEMSGEAFPAKEHLKMCNNNNNNNGNNSNGGNTSQRSNNSRNGNRSGSPSPSGGPPRSARSDKSNGTNGSNKGGKAGSSSSQGQPGPGPKNSTISSNNNSTPPPPPPAASGVSSGNSPPPSPPANFADSQMSMNGSIVVENNDSLSGTGVTGKSGNNNAPPPPPPPPINYDESEDPNVLNNVEQNKFQFGKKPYPPEYPPHLIDFLELCIQKYGSLKNCWKSGMCGLQGRGGIEVDLEMMEMQKIDFVSFCRFCRQMGYKQQLKGTWDSLGKASDNLACSFDDLNPITEGKWVVWKEEQANNYGTFLDAWRGKGFGNRPEIKCEEMIEWLMEDEMHSQYEAEQIIEWLDMDGDVGVRGYLRAGEIDIDVGKNGITMA